MKYGYLRWSDDTERRLQEYALKESGCDHIFMDFIDHVSNRNALFEHVSPGDQITIWRLDKFASSVHDLHELLNIIRERGIQFNSLQERLDPAIIKDPARFHELVSMMERLEKNLDENH